MYQIFLQCLLSDGNRAALLIVKGRANINMVAEVKIKGLLKHAELKFRNFGTDIDCLRIKASSSVELVMDLSE